LIWKSSFLLNVPAFEASEIPCTHYLWVGRQLDDRAPSVFTTVGEKVTNFRAPRMLFYLIKFCIKCYTIKQVRLSCHMFNGIGSFCHWSHYKIIHIPVGNQDTVVKTCNSW
jgi:hypothetical protein